MMRIGYGYDTHRLVEDRRLVIGGVELDAPKGLLGHSDADVLAHAITDALLGAAALGNIGQLFPDTDPAYRNADSLALLKEAYGRVRGAGYRLVNLDSTIIAEQPKLNPHVAEIRRKVAACLGVDVGAVSVKPKTREGLGPEGREESISAQAIVLLESVG